MNLLLTRRELLGLVAAMSGGVLASASRAAESEFRLATFSADVTPPLGHPLLAGATVTPVASRIDDPLFAKGFVLSGAERPFVVVSVDWCEIRNDAYDRWRDVLAEAAGTQRERVLVTSIHQHDAPLPDLEAPRILDKHGCQGRIFDLEFHERIVQSVAKALRASLARGQRVTHIGLGQAQVNELASNRRYLDADGKPHFDRSSMSGGDSVKHNASEGTVDPWLKTLTGASRHAWLHRR